MSDFNFPSASSSPPLHSHPTSTSSPPTSSSLSSSSSHCIHLIHLQPNEEIKDEYVDMMSEGGGGGGGVCVVLMGRVVVKVKGSILPIITQHHHQYHHEEHHHHQDGDEEEEEEGGGHHHVCECGEGDIINSLGLVVEGEGWYRKGGDDRPIFSIHSSSSSSSDCIILFIPSHVISLLPIPCHVIKSITSSLLHHLHPTIRLLDRGVRW